MFPTYYRQGLSEGLRESSGPSHSRVDCHLALGVSKRSFARWRPSDALLAWTMIRWVPPQGRRNSLTQYVFSSGMISFVILDEEQNTYYNE